MIGMYEMELRPQSIPDTQYYDSTKFRIVILEKCFASQLIPMPIRNTKKSVKILPEDSLFSLTLPKWTESLSGRIFTDFFVFLIGIGIS